MTGGGIPIKPIIIGLEKGWEGVKKGWELANKIPHPSWGTIERVANTVGNAAYVYSGAKWVHEHEG